MNEYHVFFHLVGGGCVRITVYDEKDIENETDRDNMANSIVKCPFIHSFENSRLHIINMSNVASITVAKAEEEVVE